MGKHQGVFKNRLDVFLVLSRGISEFLLIFRILINQIKESGFEAINQ